MDMELLQKQIRALATMPETEAPVISCYLNLEEDSKGWQEELSRRIHLLSLSKYDKREQRLIEKAFSEISRFIRKSVKADSKGVVIFARSGHTPFFLELQFSVPVPTRIYVDMAPNIYKLIELKDTYDNYVVVLADDDGARIFEINIGTITKEVWVEHPGLRLRVGREWTRLHYQNHRRERGKQFIKEKIDTIDRLMSTGDHGHLVLAGDKKLIAELHKTLPKRLSVKVIDILSLSKKTSSEEVVSATIASFISAEESESLTKVEILMNAFQQDNLAVIGAAKCLQAAIRGQMDMLVISQNHRLGEACWCNECGWVEVGEPLPAICAECGNMSLQEGDVREEVVRLAERSGCSIETVRDSKELQLLGGIGCLLRYSIEPSDKKVYQYRQ